MQDNIIVFPEPPPDNKAQFVTHALPISLTSLVGREQEMKAIHALLSRPEVRLLTLTGTAGVGKTRLAFEVAQDLVHDFADGAHVVSLASISDPALVIPTIAHSLGLRGSGPEPLLNLLKTSLRDKHQLLLLDNFEQVILAATQLVELLEACPGLKLLITSREVLRLRAEHQFVVPPLALPAPGHFPDADSLAHVPAVILFLQRAQAIHSDFHLTTDNAATIAEICLRLDGLPLAIELAAARVKLFAPQALLARLDRRLQVLTSVTRDLPVRQQTLRNTLAWSYDLLTEEEQQLFRWLSVFVSGCTLEAAEAMWRPFAEETRSALSCVVDGCASLLDKSLLQRVEQGEDGEPRLVMLETVREYAWECLKMRGEAPTMQRRHATYYLNLAEEAEQRLMSAEQEQWLDRLGRDHDNLQAALQWLVEHDEAEMALRLGGALWRFWSLRGYAREGREALNRIVLLPSGQISPLRAKVISGVGHLANDQSDYEQAEAYSRESLRLFQEQGDTQGIHACLSLLGYIALQCKHQQEACVIAEEGLTLAKSLHDSWNIAFYLNILLNAAVNQGNYMQADALSEECIALCQGENHLLWNLSVALWLRGQFVLYQGDEIKARALLEEGLTLCRRLGNKRGIANILLVLGQAALVRGEYTTTLQLLEESLTIFKEVGDRQGLVWGLQELGRLALSQGDMVTAWSRYKESLTTLKTVHHPWLIAHGLSGLAEVVAVQGQLAWAARLWGAAHTHLQSIGAVLMPLMRPNDEHLMMVTHDQLGKDGFTAAWAEGQAMTLEQVVAAQEPVSLPKPALIVPPSREVAPPPLHASLTPREMNVLRLLAQGLTSAQIAEQLVIGLVTVNSHIRSIYSKLGVTSRAAATRYALEHKLL